MSDNKIYCSYLITRGTPLFFRNEQVKGSSNWV